MGDCEATVSVSDRWDGNRWGIWGGCVMERGEVWEHVSVGESSDVGGVAN